MARTSKTTKNSTSRSKGTQKTEAPAAVILAAGEGRRMRSKLPKVVHEVCGRPMIAHVVRAAADAGCSEIVVVVGPSGPSADAVREAVHTHCAELSSSTLSINFAVQKEPLGTADAVRAGIAGLKGHDRVLILAGDVPLITTNTLKRLQKSAVGKDVVMLTAYVDDPSGYGRVIRQIDPSIGPTGEEKVLAVREHKDCTHAELHVEEINSGIYDVELKFLRKALKKIDSHNKQAELYLTDIIALAATNERADALILQDDTEVQGVNDRMQLAEVELIMRQHIVLHWMNKGVSFVDPHTAMIESTVRLGKDTVIGASVQLRGETIIGAGARIDGPTVIIDSNVAASVDIRSFCHIEQAHVATKAIVGPFARLRPGAILDTAAHVGNFVEIKNSRIGKGAKANHLAYIGDADVGPKANVGAGTITCNYDGVDKHRTTIGPGVFIGSNSTLVAPVTIEKGAYVAAGSTITKDVGVDALAFGRARQVSRSGFAKTLRKRQGKKSTEPTK